jgi:hypothetical protein
VTGEGMVWLAFCSVRRIAESFCSVQVDDAEFVA